MDCTPTVIKEACGEVGSIMTKNNSMEVLLLMVFTDKNRLDRTFVEFNN